MNRKQHLINLFFEAKNERLEKSLLAQIMQENERPLDAMVKDYKVLKATAELMLAEAE